MPTAKRLPHCESCNSRGFVIIDSSDHGQQVQACDCGRFETDDDAAEALDAFIAKHDPPQEIEDEEERRNDERDARDMDRELQTEP